MKKTQLVKQFYAVCISLLFAVLAFCQEKKIEVDINVNKDTQQWYMQPWVWVVGGAVFILLFVALIRGNSKKD